MAFTVEAKWLKKSLNPLFWRILTKNSYISGPSSVRLVWAHQPRQPSGTRWGGSAEEAPPLWCRRKKMKEESQAIQEPEWKSLQKICRQCSGVLHHPNEICIGKWSCRASVFLPSSDLSLSKSYEDFQGFRTQSPVSGEHSIQLQDLPTTPDYRVISTTTARSATANPGKIIVCTILLSNSNHSLHIILKF